MGKNQAISLVMLMLVFAVVFSSMLIHVRAVDVAITSVTPVLKTGKVGDSVRVLGTINTTSGAYRIFFANQVVASQNASGNSVDATFVVPRIVQGNHTLILQDITKNANATSWFVVSTAYYVKVDKSALGGNQLFQEDNVVTFLVNVTGGQANKVYSANLTVAFPSPLSNKSSSIVKVNTGDNGYGNNSIEYPNATLFLGTPTTNYTGTYSVTFNQTLASDSFFIGLTNASQFHRTQTVGIKAAGYKPAEPVRVRIGLSGNLSQYSFNSSADLGGIVVTNWPVPVTAKIGTYVLNLTSIAAAPTAKSKPDVQNFTIPGYSVNVTTLNLAGEPVPFVTVTVKEVDSTVESITGGSDGIVPLKLESGFYTSIVTSKSHQVATLDITVSGPMNLSVTCNLTDLRIRVVGLKGGATVLLPNVTMFITPENARLVSDINGSAELRSLWPAYNYTINAVRYGVQANITTIPTLRLNGSLVPLFNFTLEVPNLELELAVADRSGAGLSGLTVSAVEKSGGLFYEGTTDGDGHVSFDCVFGIYTVKVFDVDGILLNRTIIQMLNTSEPVTTVTLRAALYGLSVSLKVVDYFGQPLGNMRVTLQNDGLPALERLTGSDGMATFAPITGGNFTAAVYLSGQTSAYETTSFVATEPTAVVVLSLSRYIVLAGVIVDVGVFATVLVTLVTVVVVLIFEIYRRRTKGKVESETENQ